MVLNESVVILMIQDITTQNQTRLCVPPALCRNMAITAVDCKSSEIATFVVSHRVTVSCMPAVQLGGHMMVCTMPLTLTWKFMPGPTPWGTTMLYC